MNKDFKNLGRVQQFLEERHPDLLTWTAVAAQVGSTPQSISQMFARDDMRLSTAEHIARCYGYELVLVWPKKQYQNGWTPTIKERSFPHAGNLTGMGEYIVQSNWSIRQASKETGLSKEVLNRSLSKGDITLSNLVKVEESLHLDIVFDWHKKE